MLAVSRRTQKALKAIPIPGLALFLALVLLAMVDSAMPLPAFAVGPVDPLDPWPATPQMTATAGDLTGTFAVSPGTNRLLVVLVCDFDSGGSSGQTFTATYGGRALTQAVLQNDNRRQTWIGYLKEIDIASRSGSTLAVTVTGTHTSVVAYVASYSGVDQTTPVTAANGVYINNENNRPIGGPLAVNTGGYGIYGWSGAAMITSTGDTETYTEHSDLNNGGPGAFSHGVASKAFATAGTTAPSVTWSANNRVSVSFVTLNPDSYPVPTITSISPNTKTEGDAGFTLTVHGTNFVSGASVVCLDGADRTTTFVSSTQLTATIPTSDLATAPGKSITVFNPTPGGGTSAAVDLTIKATAEPSWGPIAGIIVAAAAVGLVFLLAILLVRRKHLLGADVVSEDIEVTVDDAGENHGDADAILHHPTSSGSLAIGGALTSDTALRAVEDADTYSMQLERELEKSLRRVEKSMQTTVQALSHTVETKDPYIGGHQKRVSKLACTIAKEMGLTASQIEGIRVAGLLHDIGKIAVPTEILSKPGKLSDSEFSVIKDHPIVAFDILKNIDFDWPIAQIVVQHHERLDGSGYPYAIPGKDILLEARILAVADVVEAMSSHRPYRPALGVDAALAELARGDGTLYDSDVVCAFKKVIKKRGVKKELSGSPA